MGGWAGVELVMRGQGRAVDGSRTYPANILCISSSATLGSCEYAQHMSLCAFICGGGGGYKGSRCVWGRGTRGILYATRAKTCLSLTYRTACDAIESEVDTPLST